MNVPGDDPRGNAAAVRLATTLHRLPAAGGPLSSDAMVARGRARRRAFPYGDAGAVWEDLEFDAKHLKDMERVAVVGDRALEKATVAVFDAITPVECRYFERDDADRAWSWLAGE